MVSSRSGLKLTGKLIVLTFLFAFAACGSGVELGEGPLPNGENDSERSLSTFDARSINGTGNNLKNFSWGSANTALGRLAAPAYGDGISEPAGESRPNPREISNRLSSQEKPRPNDRGLSNFVFMWGQFLDHDIDLTPDDPSQPLPIAVPSGDPFFDPDGTGLVEIDFFRSLFVPNTGTDELNPRQQINFVTAWIDGSQIYGSDEERAAWLRSGVDGKLKVSDGDLLPFNDGTQANAPDSSTDFFVAGDIRANEQAALTAMHTLFVREHNRLCDRIREEHPDSSDEQIYQMARKWVGGLIQAITFEEFLPALLGKENVLPYPGYDPGADPTILNEFATAFFRLGHSMLTEELWRLDENGQTIPEGNLSLADAFFDSTLILLSGGMDALLRGLAFQTMEEVDTRVVEGVRSFLFGAPGAGGLDLASLNLQRGRDHGLPDYNTLRVVLGLPSLRDFREITSNQDLARDMEDLYGRVDQIDPWIGVLAEDPAKGASVGKTLLNALTLQFENLRAGDHYWYEIDPAFSPQDVREIKETRLSDIIRRNSGVKNIPDDVFRVR